MNELIDHHHYIRYCKKSNIDEDGKPIPATFVLRDDEENLSGNWFEYYEKPSYKNIKSELLKKKFNIKENGYFLKLNVGLSKKKVKSIANIKFINDVEKSSHTGIYNIIRHSSLVIAKILRVSSILCKIFYFY